MVLEPECPYCGETNKAELYTVYEAINCSHCDRVYVARLAMSVEVSMIADHMSPTDAKRLL